MNDNNLTVKAYSRAGAAYPFYALKDAAAIRFNTLAPGGLYGAASFFVPYDVMEEWPVEVGAKIIIQNGLDKTVYEGVLTTIEFSLQGGRSGLGCQCSGYWSQLLMRQNIHKMWADNRLDDSAWEAKGAAYNSLDVTPKEYFDINHDDHIRFTPKAQAFVTNQYGRRVYAAPKGQTIKRITGNYELAEGAQAWVVGIYNELTDAVEWSASSSGTTTFDQTFATPAGTAWVYMQSGGNQTPGAGGTIYGQFSNLCVYTETGTITPREVLLDIAGYITDLSSDTSQIGTLATNLAPYFGAPEPTPYADIAVSATRFNDEGGNTWYPAVLSSDPNGDNKPRLALYSTAWLPNITTPDYVLDLGGRNLSDGVKISRTIDDVTNYVTMAYQDDAGKTRYITPSDYAPLKSATSIAAYGTLEPRGALNIGAVGTALNSYYGSGFIFRYADYTALQWKVSGGLQARGFVRTPSGQRVPTSEIRAGKVLRIENFLEDLAGVGLMFVITGTDYDDSSETCSISVGKPDELAAYLARRMRGQGKY